MLVIISKFIRINFDFSLFIIFVMLLILFLFLYQKHVSKNDRIINKNFSSFQNIIISTFLLLIFSIGVDGTFFFEVLECADEDKERDIRSRVTESDRKIALEVTRDLNDSPEEFEPEPEIREKTIAEKFLDKLNRQKDQ